MLWLQREQREKPEIDQQRCLQRTLGRRVHRLRHDEVADEADRIQKRRKERRLGCGSVHKGEYSTEHDEIPPLLDHGTRLGRRPVNDATVRL